MAAVERNITTNNDGSHLFPDGTTSLVSIVNESTSRRSSRVADHQNKVTSAVLAQLEPELGHHIYDVDANIPKYWNGVAWTAYASASNSGEANLQNRVIVTQNNYATTLNSIDSSKEYFVDGIVDVGSLSITVPVGGMTIRGYSFDISALISTENNHSIFVSESEAIGSGNLLITELYLQASGTNSKVLNLYSSNGSGAIEFSKVNFIACTHLGDAHGYRQWLESNTGRFGGSPTTTFYGLWSGGAKITDSIVRGMSNTTTKPLFESGGVGFQMLSRFYCEINADLGTLQALTDFNGNFPNEKTVQFQSCIISRNGVFNDQDANLTPNISATDTASEWAENVGLPNTFVDNFTKILKSVTAPVDTDVIWLEDESDHTSMYLWDDRYSAWLGEPLTYEFNGRTNVTAGNDFEINHGEYRLILNHDAIPNKLQIIMDTPSVGVLEIRGVNAGLIGTFTLDGSSRALQGNIDNAGTILKNDHIFIRLQAGSATVTNAKIYLTIRNKG